jgi:hypothetical protein
VYAGLPFGDTNMEQAHTWRLRTALFIRLWRRHSYRRVAKL